MSIRARRAELLSLGANVVDILTEELESIGADGSGSFTTVDATTSVTSQLIKSDLGVADFQLSNDSGGDVTLTLTGDPTTEYALFVSANQIAEQILCATGEYTKTLTANLADAYSITDGVGNLLVFGTTTGARVITIGGGVAADSVQVGGVSTAKVGFFAVAPVVRTGAFTQTYATASHTHSNPTAAVLTVTDGAGTNDGTIAAITGDASVIAAVQELAAQINKLVADDANTKQVLNALIDDLQLYGLSQ